MAKLAYSRALLKISGEAFAGGRASGIDFGVIERLSDELKQVAATGVQLGLVIGGGNILRGTTASQQGMDRVSADYMGMLATIINALALQDILEKKGVDTRVMSAIRMQAILKATNVDGIYTADPKKDPSAKFLPSLTFQEALVNGYAVMDANAFGLCKENKLPIVVFNINQPGATARVLTGERVGTIVQ